MIHRLTDHKPGWTILPKFKLYYQNSNFQMDRYFLYSNDYLLDNVTLIHTFIVFPFPTLGFWSVLGTSCCIHIWLSGSQRKNRKSRKNQERKREKEDSPCSHPVEVCTNNQRYQCKGRSPDYWMEQRGTMLGTSQTFWIGMVPIDQWYRRPIWYSLLMSLVHLLIVTSFRIPTRIKLNETVGNWWWNHHGSNSPSLSLSSSHFWRSNLIKRNYVGEVVGSIVVGS